MFKVGDVVRINHGGHYAAYGSVGVIVNVDYDVGLPYRVMPFTPLVATEGLCYDDMHLELLDDPSV